MWQAKACLGRVMGECRFMGSMLKMQLRDPAAALRPGHAENLPPEEGVGDAGCPVHPQMG
jgi:hypothetical protein